MPLVRKALVIGLILVLLSYAWYARSGARPTIPAPLQLKIEEKHRVELEVAALTQKVGLLSAQNAKLRANLVAAGRAVPPRIAAAMVTVPVVAPVVTHSFMTTASGCIVEDGRLRGVDIKTVPMPLKIGSTNDCCEACRMHLEACSLWTYDKVKKQCWLKSKAEPVTEADRAVRNWLFGNMNHLLKPPPPPPVDVLGNPVSDGILRLNPPWMESSVSAVSPLGPSSPQQPAAAAAAPAEGQCHAQDNSDRAGGDLDTMPSMAKSADDCCDRCTRTYNCNAWTFVKRPKHCWLKGAAARPGKSSECCISGQSKSKKGVVMLPPPPPHYNAPGGAATLSAPSEVIAGAALGKKSLCIAIPTVARGQDAPDYISMTMDSIINQAESPDNIFEFVEVMVMTHTPEAQHPWYTKVKSNYGSYTLKPGQDPKASKAKVRVSFEDDSGSTQRNYDKHATDQEPVDDKHNPEDRPGPKVRQQSMDLLNLIKRGKGRADYLLLTEDDATLCPGGLAEMARHIAHANHIAKHWSLLRGSIGFIGILVPNDELDHLAAFIGYYYLAKPPDLLLMEWMHSDWPGSVRDMTKPNAKALAGLPPQTPAEFYAWQKPRPRVKYRQQPSKPHFVSMRNMFFHHGRVSSLRVTAAHHFPSCNARLSLSLWYYEAFDNQCQRYGLSPCTGDFNS